MAIQSSGEFEIITNTILMRIAQRLDNEPHNRLLITAKRGMEEGLAWAIQKKKPDAKQLASFAEAAETIRQAWREDTELSDKLFDMLDFLEYQL